MQLSDVPLLAGRGDGPLKNRPRSGGQQIELDLCRPTSLTHSCVRSMNPTRKLESWLPDWSPVMRSGNPTQKLDLRGSREDQLPSAEANRPPLLLPATRGALLSRCYSLGAAAPRHAPTANFALLLR